MADFAPGSTPHTVRQTAAAAITVPASTLTLAHVTIKGHATEPSVLGFALDGINVAMLFCPADGWAEFDVSHAVGTALPATWCTVISDDTPQAWTLTFDKSGYGPALASWQGIYFECEVANSGTPVVGTYPAGECVPVAIIGGQTTGVAAANARWAFPAQGDVQQIVEVPDGAVAGAEAMAYKQAPPLPKSTTLTLTPTVVGAATYANAVVYYQKA